MKMKVLVSAVENDVLVFPSIWRNDIFYYLSEGNIGATCISGARCAERDIDQKSYFLSIVEKLLDDPADRNQEAVEMLHEKLSELNDFLKNVKVGELVYLRKSKICKPRRCSKCQQLCHNVKSCKF
jgi:hypothetical protein